MFRKIAIVSAVVLSMTGQAFAGQCPSMVKAIDAALQTASLSEADKAKVMELRNKGEAEHKAGSHAESVNTLNEAKKMLGM